MQHAINIILSIGLFIASVLNYTQSSSIRQLESEKTHQTALGEVYEAYNHIRIYEDGSYIAETKQGQKEWGCIKVALCND